MYPSTGIFGPWHQHSIKTQWARIILVPFFYSWSYSRWHYLRGTFQHKKHSLEISGHLIPVRGDRWCDERLQQWARVFTCDVRNFVSFDDFLDSLGAVYQEAYSPNHPWQMDKLYLPFHWRKIVINAKWLVFKVTKRWIEARFQLLYRFISLA